MHFKLVVTLTFALIFSGISSPLAIAKPTPGGSCAKAGIKQTSGNKTYTCIKLGKKLYWNNGVSRIKPKPVEPSANPQPSINPSSNIPSCGFGFKVPLLVSSLQAEWVQEDLKITFDWDYANASDACQLNGQTEKVLKEFVIEVTVDGVKRRAKYGLFPVNRTQTAQTLNFTRAINENTIGVLSVKITSVCIFAIDRFYNSSTQICNTSIPKYVLSFGAPEIKVSSG
jgi:hypothetical protein